MPYDKLLGQRRIKPYRAKPDGLRAFSLASGGGFVI